MTQEAVMNQNGQLAHKMTVPPQPVPITGGIFVVTSIPSLKVLAPSGGPGVYAGPLSYTFSGGSATGFQPGSIVSAGPQTINPTAQFVDVDGLMVIREGDFGTMSCSGTLLNGSPGTIVGPVEVSDAGQTDFLAE